MNPNFCVIDCLQNEKNRHRDIAALQRLVDEVRHQPTRKNCLASRLPPPPLTIVNRNLLIASTAKRRTVIVIVVIVANRRHLVNRATAPVARNHPARW